MLNSITSDASQDELLWSLMTMFTCNLFLYLVKWASGHYLYNDLCI